MPLGYGYIRDDEPAIVDWAAITKDARESIKKIEEDRQKKREGVDQAIRDQSEALLNRPKSQNVQYNTAMSNMTSQIEARMLQNYNDLRLGNINLNQFNATKNTMMSETKGVLAIAKTYAEQYDANVEGAQNGTLSGYSNWTNAMTQEMMDFQGVETYVGPNGKISFVKKREDGTTETLDTSELFTLANMKQQKYDLNQGIEDAKANVAFSYKDEFGKTVTGYFIDPTTGEINNDELDKSAAAMVTQDSNAYGILYDYIGGYDFERLSDDFYTQNQTREEQEAALKELHKDNPNTIYVDINGMPAVSDKQREIAKDYVRDKLETVAITSQTEAEYGIEDKLQEEIDNLVARTANTKASTNLINARIGEIEGETETSITLNMPAIEEFIRKEISGPIAAGFERGEGMRFPFTKGWLTDKDNQITKRLKDILGNFGITIDSQRLLKQQIELRVPKPGGTYSTVEIDIRNLTPEQIVNEITEAVIYVPDENLEFIYNRFIKGSDEDSSSGDTSMGN